MSRRHADNWSHPGHYLVDPYTWPWSPNGHGHEWPTATPFVQCQSALPFWDTAISKFDHENPWSRSCVWSKVKVTFDLENSKVKVMVKVKPDGHIWDLGVQSICLLFVSWQLDHFWLRYSKFYIWPWIFKVKVMAKVKPDGHIWALESNRYVCFSFRGNRTIFGWDIIANWWRRTNRYKNIKSPPVYRGDLIRKMTVPGLAVKLAPSHYQSKCWLTISETSYPVKHTFVYLEWISWIFHT